jgi:hypothetical protein
MSSGVIAFNVAFVAHGTKAGVCISPWSVFIVPLRARERDERCDTEKNDIQTLS